jgi:hypothetical protein
MAVINGGNGEPCVDQLLEELVRPRRLRKVAAVAEQPSASVVPRHEWRRGGRSRHPDVQLKRAVSGGSVS